MIFLLFFALIAVIIVGLNFLDNSNVNKIETYFKAQECRTISYIKGQYRGLCKDKIILIRNAFRVDVSVPEKLIHYKEIKEIQKTNKALVITTKNDSVILEFKEVDKLEIFYSEIQKKMK